MPCELCTRLVGVGERILKQGRGSMHDLPCLGCSQSQGLNRADFFFYLQIVRMTALANWSVERCLMLISLWEKYPWIYDPAHPDYLDRNKTKNALTEIAHALGDDLTENDVRLKMRSLRTSLLQQIVSYNARYKSGANENDVAEPAWIYWKELCFLRPFIKTRKGPDNLSLTSATTSQSPEEETGDLKALLTSVGSITEETAEAVAASPRVYQETPSPKAPDLAKKKRSDTPSPAQQAVEILKDMQAASEERRKKATYNELFFQMVARAMEDFPKDIQHQLQFDIFKMIHETRVKLLNTE